MEEDEKDTILVSFSGGRTSALMGRLIQISPMYEKYKKVFVYANTGKERKETLDFIHKCDEEFGFGTVWLEAVITQTYGVGPTYKIVTYETALHNKSEGVTPFDDLVEKLDIPNPAKSGHCTRDLKIVPIQKYMKEAHGLKAGRYWSATGIRADEKHRKSRSASYIHPMMELGFTEKHVRDFWAQQPFDLQLKDYQGNCDLCFKKSLKKRMTIIKEDPECAEWWNKVEKGSKKGYIFDRDRLSIETIIQMSQDLFRESEDKHDIRQKEYAIEPSEFDEFEKDTALFDDLDLDFETDCFCKAT